MWRTLSLALVALSLLAGMPGEAARPTRRTRRPPVPPQLVWHVETLAGEAIDSREADTPINPASVVKVATSLWALERLGPDLRFETRFSARGQLDPKWSVLRGDLVVTGAGDPDFHAENAFLVALALNQIGVREVRGPLIVSRKFFIGWENGSAGTNADPFQRGLAMATRLRQALDPKRWNGDLRRAWRELARRRGFDPARPPRVGVAGGVGVDGEASTGELLVVHRSEPLASALRRFNCFSNNDIERVGKLLGPVDELSSVITLRCAAAPETVSFETTSGLGTNRLTPRTIVRLLREFRETCTKAGLAVESMLSVAGCDPGTVTRFFPLLASGAYATSVMGKTGTLTSTDGGVSVIAGFANTADGELVFCLAAPHAGSKLRLSRRTQEKWLLDLLASHGGPRPRTCAPPLPDPDSDASIIVVKGGEPPPAPPSAAP
ncbi:MAG: D-alanyl-D-alanine carboxypeptidase [Acidobacteriota bacterium]